MKKAILLLAAVITATLANAQGFFEPVSYVGAMGPSENWAASWTEWNPNSRVYPGDPASPANTVTVTADITSNTTWTNNNVYMLRGLVRVKNGVTLTIEAGTVIRGYVTSNDTEKGTLLVARGGKLVAVGTPSQPIVFTSGKAAGYDGAGESIRQRGDWGGILICGRAHVNTPSGVRQYEALVTEPDAEYGGGLTPNDNDNSGELRYVRIEYAGFAYVVNQELNSLTLAGVGKGTSINYVQCSYGNDDSFEWFGGAVDHKYLIAFAGTDDDFDMDEGYNGRVQFGLAVRHPLVYEYGTGTSNAFEHDNNTNFGGSGTPVVPGNPNPTPITRPQLSNITIVGPIRAGEAPGNLASAARARFGRALELRSNASTQLFNSVVMGYPQLLRLNNGANTVVPSTQTKALADSLTIRNTVFSNARWVGGASRIAGSSNAPANYNGSPFSFNAGAWLADAAKGNDTSRFDGNSLQLVAPFYTGTPNGSFDQVNFANVDFRISGSSPLATMASFADSRLATQIASIKGTSLATATRIYPNPATATTLTIAYEARGTEQMTAQLYDMQGRLVKTAFSGEVSGHVTATADLAGLQSGIYMLHVSTAHASEVHKLIIK